MPPNFAESAAPRLEPTPHHPHAQLANFPSPRPSRSPQIFEYGYDLSFYGNNFMGGPTSAAQGKGYLEEFYSRLTQKPITKYDSSTNSTLDSNPITFPLNQSIYADAAHEVSILDFFAALNLTALSNKAPSATHPESDGHTFITSQVVPM